MDYEIKPVKREHMRDFAKLFRKICGLSDDEAIEPVELLETLPDLEDFEDVSYEVVYNNKLEGSVPTQCIMSVEGYLIQIKESVYNGAYEKRTGGHRMHIVHEIMHVFLDKLGVKPISDKPIQKKDNIPAFKSLEWAVQALAGELMMPYEATKGMSVEEIMKKYGVSKNAAKKRLMY